MQGIVNRCQRHPDTGSQRFAMQLFGCEVTLPTFEKQPRQRHSLPSGPQIYGA
jgi:hypothetical protein